MAGLLAAQARGEVPVVVAATTADAVAERLLAAAAVDAERYGPEPLLVVLTSGSSGSPRAVVRTVASWTVSFPAYTALAGYRAGDVAWAPGEASSTLTLFALWHALATGVPVVATGRWLGVGRAGAAAADATVLHAVPPVAADALAGTDQLPRLRRTVVAGGTVPASLRTTAAARGVEVAEYYGAAELSFVAADPDGAGLRPFPGAQVRECDGAIEVRSPYVALGYLAGHDGPLTVRDGWAGVGDVGRFADGVLTVAGRSGAAGVAGHVVVLAEVEAALGGVEGVAEVVCVGEPHDRWGERVVAVVRRGRGGPDAHTLRARLRATARALLPPPARPARYVVVDDLPRTPGGKVARPAAEDLARRLGRRDRDTAGMTTDGAVRLSRTFPADLDQVWRALTDPAELAAWFWPADYGTTVEADARVGGRYRIAAAPERRLAVEGEYLEVAAPRRLVASWRWDGDDVRSVVRLDLLGGEHGSGLTLTHEGLPPEDVPPHEQGWTDSLDRLVDHLT